MAVTWKGYPVNYNAVRTGVPTTALPSLPRFTNGVCRNGVLFSQRRARVLYSSRTVRNLTAVCR